LGRGLGREVAAVPIRDGLGRSTGDHEAADADEQAEEDREDTTEHLGIPILGGGGSRSVGALLAGVRGTGDP
jgi:hypothetical protein